MRANYVIAGFVCLVFFVQAPAGNARQTSTSTQTGYVRFVPQAGTSAPAGVAIFGGRTNGVLVTEAGIPFTTTVQSGRIFVEVDSSVNTAIALANPADRDINISYYFTDNSGRNFGAGTFTVLANHQISAFVTNPPFALASRFSGTLTFNASGPVAAVGLRSFVNERSDVLLTSTPVSPLGKSWGGSALLLPALANSTALTMDVVLVNPGDTTLSGTLRFYGPGSKTGSVQPAKVVVNGVTSSSFNYSVAPRSFYRLQPQQPRSGTPIGSVRVTPNSATGMPSAFEILAYHNAAVTVSMAGVTALPSALALRAYVESSGTFGDIASMQTMLTVFNPSGTKVTVQMNLMKLDGTFSGLSTNVDISAGGQISKSLTDLFPAIPSPFRGVVRMTTPFPVVLTASRNRYNERGDLLMTDMQPYDEAAPALPEMEFPQFVNGGGYSTQFVLISTGLPQTGSLYLVNQDGTVLPSTSLQPSP